MMVAVVLMQVLLASFGNQMMVSVVAWVGGTVDLASLLGRRVQVLALG